MAVPRCAPFGACLNCSIEKTACRIHCTNAGDAFGARGEYGCASDRAFQTTVGTDDKGTYDHLDQRNACTSDACLCSTYKRILSHSAHKGKTLALLAFLLYKRRLNSLKTITNYHKT